MADQKQRVKKEALVSCLSCGATSTAFVIELKDGGLAPKAACPKCHNTAYTNNLHGLWHFQQAVAKAIAQINLDLLDLQDDGEER